MQEAAQGDKPYPAYSFVFTKEYKGQNALPLPAPPLSTPSPSPGIADDLYGGVAALGNFDGVHPGHQAILSTARTLALELSTASSPCPAIALSFEPHPRAFFGREQPNFRLTPPPLKAGFIARTGVDGMVTLTFNNDLASLSAHSFIEDWLINSLGLRAVVCGPDFRFGKGREGSVDLLKAIPELEVQCIPPVFAKSDPPASEAQEQMIYASSTIREKIRAGDIITANNLLGRHYLIAGLVVKGRQLGRILGFPTANIDLGDALPPAFGVYAARVYLENGDCWPAALNYGIKPTLQGDNAPCFEAHLLDFSGILYDQQLQIELIERIRPEQAFSDLAALKAQISQDCEAAKTILKDKG